MPQRTDPTVKWMDVTPKLAADWLNDNTGNRNKRARRIATYARDMTHGNWLVTGDTIKFDTDGRLVDAQHRLEAIIASGTTQRMLVVRGLNPRVQDVLDTNLKRSASDALNFNNIGPHVHVIAAVARLDKAWTTGKLRRVTLGRSGGALDDLTNSEVVQWADENPDIHEASAFGQGNCKTLLAAPSPLAFAVLLTGRVDPVAAKEFWTSTVDMRTNGPGDPRHTLIRSLKNDASTGRNAYQSVQLSYHFRAWNAWREGRKIRSLPIASGARDAKTGRPVGVMIPEPQ